MAASVKKQPKKRMSRAARKEAITGYLYLLPNFIGFFIFTAIPIILGLLISFTDYNGFKWKFVGISNYLKMFGDSQFKAALVNNLVYSVVSVPLTIAFSLILALALNRKLFGGGFFKTVFFFPNLTSMVAIGCIAMLLFQPVDGPVNQALRAIGIAQEHLPKWFMSTKTALLTVIIVVVWKQAGYYMIMFMGGLKSIPNHLYEAAKIDGANEFQVFTKICIPICKGVITTCAILVFMDYWNMVEQPLLFFNDTDKYPLSIFLSKINAQEVGLAFAVATFYMIPSLLIFLYGEDQLVEGIAYQGGVKG